VPPPGQVGLGRPAGLGDTTGARVLAELGDDRDRFTDARAVKAYADAAPMTRASGKSISVTHRRVKNDRFAAAGWIWAFCAHAHSPAARQHYRRRRDIHGDRHAQTHLKIVCGRKLPRNTHSP